MPSPWKPQPEVVVDKVLKRVEVSKIARRLQNRLALAQFKTKHGWEDLAFDTIEPKYEEEMRRRRLRAPPTASSEGDIFSDSSSSTSELPYPARTLMSSPLKAPMFSDAVGSSNGSTGHRKRTYMATFGLDSNININTQSSPTKRFRDSPLGHKSFSLGGNGWRDSAQLTQSSPIKPKRHMQKHFTTSTGPNVSFFQGTGTGTRSLLSLDDLSSTANYTVQSDDDDDDDDDDDLLPAHSFNVTATMRSSPPRTPPPMASSNRTLESRRARHMMAGNGPEGGTMTNTANTTNVTNTTTNSRTGEEGVDLLLYLATSPSPAVPSTRTAMNPPLTPPPKNNSMTLTSSLMTTPGGGSLFPNTPGQPFDFADFIKFTPSPAQRTWKTPRSVARRRLTFDEPLA